MSTSNSNTRQPVGVIGAGSFGTAIANLIAINTGVLLYSRNKELVNQINKTRKHRGINLPEAVTLTNDLQQIARECTLIFPIVPAANFRSMMKDIGPYLRPYHMLIHGTKGFDITGVNESEIQSADFDRSSVHTMSEVIRQESSVVRVGCLSGPNLSAEILAGQPAATVIGSRFREVIKSGRRVLNSGQFHVFGTFEILGAELAGAMKNAIAIGSGVLGGLGMGKNIQAMLITRGLVEMVNIGKAMGANSNAFIGTAGIGDLIATTTSTKSRNYTFGNRLGKGETYQEILNTMEEPAEGVRTIAIMRRLATNYKLRAPITEMLYRVVFEAFSVERAIEHLMNYPYAVDVDFI